MQRAIFLFERWTGQLPNFNENCAKRRDALASWAVNIGKIDTVYIASYWTGYLSSMPTIGAGGSLDDARLLDVERGFTETLTSFKAIKRVIVIGDTPAEFTVEDPVSCYLASTSGLLRRPCQVEPNAKFRSMQARVNSVVQKTVSAFPNARYIDGFAPICTGQECATVINGEFIYRDRDHFRRNMQPETNRDIAARFGLISTD